MIRIKFNNSKLGKRWIFKQYDKQWLVRAYPTNNISEIYIQGFTLRELKWVTQY